MGPGFFSEFASPPMMPAQCQSAIPNASKCWTFSSPRAPTPAQTRYNTPHRHPSRRPPMPSRMSVGNAELVGVLDMIPPSRDPTAFFPETTTEAWAPYADDILEEGRLQLYFGCFFVRTSDKCVLVDTGMGPGPHPDRENRTGDLINQLKRSGPGTRGSGHRRPHPPPP